MTRTHPERALPLGRQPSPQPGAPPSTVLTPARLAYLQRLADAFAIEHRDTRALTWARQAELLADSRRADYGRAHRSHTTRTTPAAPAA